MAAIALIAGFALGAGCAVALLIGLGLAARVVSKAGASKKQETGYGTFFGSDGAEGSGKAHGPIDRQWQNLWNYDGTPQKPEGVNENANQD